MVCRGIRYSLELVGIIEASRKLQEVDMSDVDHGAGGMKS